MAAAGQVAGVVLVVYGWLMWTSWASWRASSRHSLAHWFASIHVLPHNHSAGLVVMAIGAVVLVYALVVGGRGTSFVPSGGHGPDTRRLIEFAGITKQAKFAYGKTAITIAALLVAIQWPLHMDPGIQSILTTQVAIYVLLAMGLNVVVGFAGLLDLGYIAFWAIGSYTTAYFTGALPIQPPFILNPFWIIPFAIVAAMLTGVLLGTPTLRLRGDYLAIVTLGFGEIIEIVANNLNGVTGGPAGTPGVIPQFSVHLLSRINYGWTGTVLALLLPDTRGGGRLHGGLQLPRAVPCGTVLDGDPRRRGGGRLRGHQRAEVQGHGLRHRGLDLRVRRSLLREPGAEPRPERLHRPDVDPGPRLRDLRRHGFDRRCRDRCRL